MCFWMSENATNSTLTFFIIRYDRENEIYKRVSVSEIEMSSESLSSSILNPSCGYFGAKDRILVEAGDYFGFMCNEFLHIALEYSTEERENTSLKVYRSQKRRSATESSTLSFEAIHFEDVKDGNKRVFPLVQVILGMYFIIVINESS